MIYCFRFSNFVENSWSLIVFFIQVFLTSGYTLFDITPFCEKLLGLSSYKFSYLLFDPLILTTWIALLYSDNALIHSFWTHIVICILDNAR